MQSGGVRIDRYISSTVTGTLYCYHNPEHNQICFSSAGLVRQSDIQTQLYPIVYGAAFRSVQYVPFEVMKCTIASKIIQPPFHS